MASNKRGKGKSDSGWMDTARDNGLTAAVAVGGAVAAGAFLWSRRAQISDELSRLGEQIGEWRDSLSAESETGVEDDQTAFIAKPRRTKAKSNKSQREIAEEALTLKDSAPTAKRPLDPIVEDQLKAGAVAY